MGHYRPPPPVFPCSKIVAYHEKNGAGRQGQYDRGGKWRSFVRTSDWIKRTATIKKVKSTGLCFVRPVAAATSARQHVGQFSFEKVRVGVIEGPTLKHGGYGERSGRRAVWFKLKVRRGSPPARRRSRRRRSRGGTGEQPAPDIHGQRPAHLGGTNSLGRDRNESVPTR